MPKTIGFKSQPFVSKSYILLNPIEKINLNYPKYIDFSSKSVFLPSLTLISHQTHIPKPILYIPKPILCARKKRSGFGSQKLKKILPRIVSIAASNLKILPEPFNLVIAEFSGGGGNGGGSSWFWKGFDGWRRKRKKINLGFFVVCGLGLVLFGAKRELKIDVFYGVLALGLTFNILIKGVRRGVKDLVLELCFVGALMGLRLKREDMQQWCQKVRVCSPAFEIVKGKRRKNCTRFW